MTTPRALAIIRTADDFRRAIREWCVVTHITRADLDARAGLADGHASKLLSPRQIKKFGFKSFPLVLAAAGLALVLVEDDEAAAALDRELVSANACDDSCEPTRPHWRSVKGRTWGRRMAARRALKLTAGRRSEIASNAAQARWRQRGALSEDS